MDVMPTNDRSEGSHRGVERIARILGLAAASPTGVRLTDVADRLDAPRSSVHSLLKGMVAVDFLVVRNNRYAIGPGIRRLLAPYRASSIVEIAKDEIESLSRKFNETALLGTVIDNSVVYLFQSESTELIHYAAPLGEPRPLYPTTIGKQFLASLDDEELAEVRASLEVEDADRVVDEIVETRRTELSYNREETVKGTTAVAAAIHGGDGVFIGAVSVVGPIYRMDEEQLAQIGAEVLAAARRISYRLAVQESADPAN